VDNYVDMMYC